MKKYKELFLNKVYAFIKKDFLIDISYTLSFLMKWVEVIVVVFVFYYFSQFIAGNKVDRLASYGGNYFPFILIGFAGFSCFNACVSGFVNTLTREQWAGTLEVFLTTPNRLSLMIFSFAFYNIIKGLLEGGFYLYLGTHFFGVDFGSVNLLAVFIIIFLATISFLSIGTIVAAGIIMFKRGEPLVRMLSYFIWIMGGAYFPITIFPKYLQKISLCLPSTYALEALRFALLQGYSLIMLKDDIFLLAVFSIFLAPLSYFIFKSAILYAKKQGTIVFH